MSNSNLVSYTKLSPNFNKRTKAITKITIHHMAGNLSIEGCGDVFAKASRKASSNYGIGTDGRIAMYVEECTRAWTSSNATNDQQAITIEVANDGGADSGWHVSDTAYESLIKLCVDICKRNGIANINFTGDKNGNLTMHKYFAATACPGPYLESKFPDIAARINAALKSESGSGSGSESKSESGYLVKVTAAALNIRKNAGTSNPVVGCIRDNGVYTIVEEKNVSGIIWGKLKSGLGWISLKYTKRI